VIPDLVFGSRLRLAEFPRATFLASVAIHPQLLFPAKDKRAETVTLPLREGTVSALYAPCVIFGYAGLPSPRIALILSDCPFFHHKSCTGDAAAITSVVAGPA